MIINTDQNQIAAPEGFANQFLCKTATDFTRPEIRIRIYDYIGECLSFLNPEAVVLVNSIDFDNLLLRNEVFISPQINAGSITTLLGFDPLHKVFKVNKNILRLVKGSLFKINHGLHHLTFQTIPKTTAKQIEEIVGSGDMYAIAFTVDKIIYGVAAIILPENIQLQHAGTLEVFIKQAAVTIRSIQAERNEEKYRSMFEFMSQGAFYQTADGVNTDVNQAALDILDISRMDFLNKKYISEGWHIVDENLNLISPEDLSPNIALRTKSPVRNRVLGVFNPDKQKYAWVISNAIPIFLPGSAEPHRVFATLQDITAIKSAEEKLSKSVAELEQLHNIISRSPTFVVSWKVQPDSWPVLFITANVERLLGYKSDDFTSGRINWSDIIHPEDQQRVDDTTFRHANDGVEEWALEYRLISASGQVMWFRDQNVAIKSTEGVTVQIQSVVTDITATKKSEKELNRSQARAAALLEAIPDLMFRLDENGVYLDFKAAKDELYIRDQSFLGKNISDLLPENLAKKTTEMIRKTLLTKTIQEFEYSLDIPEKGIQYFESRMVSSGRHEVTTIVRNITARKKREKEFRDLVEYAPVGIYRICPDGQILMANPALVSMLGYESFDELKSRNLQFEGYEKSYSRQTFLDTILRDGQVHAMEANWKTKCGQSIIVSESARVVRNDIGELLHFEGMVIDITERKKAGALIRENEANLKAIIENSNDSIWSINRNYEIQYVNQRFALEYKSVFGADLSKGVNKLLTLPSALQTLWKERYDKALRNEHFVIIDKVETGADPIFIEVSANPIVFEGLVTGVALSGRNITQRMLDEEKLQRSEERWRSIIKTSPDGMAVMKLDGTLEFISDTLAKWHGFENGAQMTGKNAFDFIDDSYHDKAKKIVEQMMQGVYVGAEEFMLLRKDGSTFFVEMNAEFLFDSDGKPESIFMIERDIADRKKADLALKESERNLRDLNATKDKFFSIIAHDLRSPFNSILGFSTMLRDEAAELDKEQVMNYAGIIKKSATQTLQLLDNLLEWARLQQGKVTYNPRLLVLHEAVKDVAEMLRASAKQKNISVVNEVPANIIVHADEDMLHTVIRNLLGNALKFTPQEGRVALKASHEDGFVVFQVIDNGIGISPENISKLFNPASDFTMRGTANEKGTGIGLMLCKEFIEMHGGQISVQSEPGQGSRFIVQLPVLS